MSLAFLSFWSTSQQSPIANENGSAIIFCNLILVLYNNVPQLKLAGDDDDRTATTIRRHTLSSFVEIGRTWKFFCSLELILTTMASRGRRWSIQIVISSCVQLPIGVRSVASSSREPICGETLPLITPNRKKIDDLASISFASLLRINPWWEIFHSNQAWLTPGVKTRKGNVPFVYGFKCCRIIIFRVEDDWVKNEDQTYGHGWISGLSILEGQTDEITKENYFETFCNLLELWFKIMYSEHTPKNPFWYIDKTRVRCRH